MATTTNVFLSVSICGSFSFPIINHVCPAINYGFPRHESRVLPAINYGAMYLFKNLFSYLCSSVSICGSFSFPTINHVCPAMNYVCSMYLFEHLFSYLCSSVSICGSFSFPHHKSRVFPATNHVSPAMSYGSRYLFFKFLFLSVFVCVYLWILFYSSPASLANDCPRALVQMASWVL